MSLTALLGDKVQGKKGEVHVSQLGADNKVIGIYFSAHWCPPCRGFTPVLCEWYEMIKEEDDGLEIVFVSSDRDEASFNEYYATMPWCALPFNNRSKKEELSNAYGVRGIPTLVFVNGKGELLTKEGRGIVAAGKKLKDIK